MITFRQTGSFNKTRGFLERAKEGLHIGTLDKYGREGVAVLTAATPVDSGETANSWSYEIQNKGESVAIVFHNTHINKGVNIAIILQYGHGTGTGGYVQGRDYINPAVKPVFDRLADEVWKEVTKV